MASPVLLRATREGPRGHSCTKPNLPANDAIVRIPWADRRSRPEREPGVGTARDERVVDGEVEDAVGRQGVALVGGQVIQTIARRADQHRRASRGESGPGEVHIEARDDVRRVDPGKHCVGEGAPAVGGRPVRLQLDVQRNPRTDAIENVVEARNPGVIVRAELRRKNLQLREFRPSQLMGDVGTPDQSRKVAIVKHEGNAVGADLDVELDPVAAGRDRGLEGASRVLGRHGAGAAVGDDGGHGSCSGETSCR